MSKQKRQKRSDSRDFEPDYIQQPVRTVEGEVFIKKYKKIKQVGSGSYSKCYLVKNTDSDSTYVAKIIPKKKLEILEKEKLFYEIKIHKQLSHPNVVHLDHWFEDQTYQYIFMQYCSKGNLQNLLKKGGKMEESQIKQYVYQIVQGIAYIHEQKILHRDLKLCNFYLDQNDNVKLGDFGFACQLANDYQRKRQTCGTPNYIAPEVISGFGYSFYSDVWSIGVILYRLRYGFCPFQGQQVRETLENVKLCKYRWPKTPKPSSQMKDLIQKIFTLNYDDRLTPQQILNHRFFDDCRNPKSKKKTSQKFSFSNILPRSQSKSHYQQKNKSSKKREQQNNDGPRRKSILEREDTGRKNSVKNNEEDDDKKVKKYNSCDTFKQIKQIFKSKSKKSLNTNSNQTNSTMGLSGSVYRSYNTNSSIPTSQNSTYRGDSKRNELNYTLGDTMDFMGAPSQFQKNFDDKQGKQMNRVKRLNDFIKKQSNTLTFKEEMKKKKSMNLNNPGHTPLDLKDAKQEKKKVQIKDLKSPQLKIMVNNSQKNQVLHNAVNKYYLPHSVQQEKDLIIVHYQPFLKHIMFGDTVLIMHMNAKNLYDATGERISFDSLSKVHRYILQNKVKIENQDLMEQQYDLIIHKSLVKLPKECLSFKQGIILKYGASQNLLVSKLFIQESFHMWDTIRTGTNGFTMYTVDSQQKQQPFEGIVVMRIYTGWVKNMIAKK